MKITIIGGGNVGTQLAVHCSQENDTYIYTSLPELFVPDIQIVDEKDKVTFTGKNITATSNPDEAFSDVDYVFVTYPAFMLAKVAKELLPYAHKGMKVGIVPGTGGGECAFSEYIAKGVTVFGLQRVPSVARIVEKGKKVRAVGYRDKLYVATIPAAEAPIVAKDVARLIGVPCDAMPNYLNLTLTPSNPILHTVRLKSLYEDYHDGVFYEKVPLFYEEWSNEASEMIFKCDAEVQNICKALSDFDLSFVKPLPEHYESTTPEEMTAKIRSIKGFKGLTSPAVETEKGFIPDFGSRYFTADFPYGLSILVQIGDFLELDIPNMKSVLNWYRQISGDKNDYSFAEFGINNLDDFLKFYKQ